MSGNTAERGVLLLYGRQLFCNEKQERRRYSYGNDKTMDIFAKSMIEVQDFSQDGINNIKCRIYNKYRSLIGLWMYTASASKRGKEVSVWQVTLSIGLSRHC